MQHRKLKKDSMANEQNLRPVRTKEEARERGRNGGIASGKARRKKASLIRAAQFVLESDMPANIREGIEKMTGIVSDENDTLFTAATAVMAKEAISGNVQAYRELKDVVRMIEERITVDESIEDDSMSAALEEFAESAIDGC